MSRMTKLLKQTCKFEKARRDSSGTVLLDKFGEVQYGTPITIKCRREKLNRDVQTNTGAVIQSTTRYFTDESYEVDVGDRFDGKTVLSTAEYINQFGSVEGYESYV